MDFLVSVGHIPQGHVGLTMDAEEFNKYLSYVRNLGFEDTPDYDYLRDLFTQALKNTGEVEDGEYDWMKLNNGKGWEAQKQHPTHLHAPNGMLNPSARVLAGGPDTPRGPQTPGIARDRLNAPQPPAPSPAKPGVGKTRERPGASGVVPQKRQSGAAGGLTEVVTPTASTQAQFQSSTANLPQRMSQANPNANQHATAQQASRQPNMDPKPSAFQKLMKVLCCSR